MKSIILRDGVRLAYQEWGTASADASKRVLALHGWLDNSNSFSYMGPKFAELGYHCVALDHLGHGWSGHLPALASNYSGPKYVSSVLQFLEAFDWGSTSIVAHSMGTGVAMLLAGSFPEKVDKLVMMDGFGPVTYAPEKAAKAMHKSIEAEGVAYNKMMAAKGPKLYDSFDAAVKARVASVSTYPGKQHLSTEAAEALVSRGCYVYNEAAEDGGKGEYVHVTAANSEKVKFRHDQSLLMPSPYYFSNGQLMSFTQGITASTLVLVAEDGWPADKYANHEERASCLREKGLFHMTKLPGSHHFHLDPSSAPVVFNHVAEFLTTDASSDADDSEHEPITPDGVAV